MGSRRDGGVSTAANVDALKSPISKIFQKDGRMLYKGKDAFVVIDPKENNAIITVIPQSSKGPRTP